MLINHHPFVFGGGGARGRSNINLKALYLELIRGRGKSHKKTPKNPGYPTQIAPIFKVVCRFIPPFLISFYLKLILQYNNCYLIVISIKSLMKIILFKSHFRSYEPWRSGTMHCRLFETPP